MSLLGIRDIEQERMRHMVDLGLAVKADPRRYRTALHGRSVGLFFAKPSLRTWVSADVAAGQLGMHPLVIPNAQVGLGTREAPEDVGRVLDRYLDLVAMRVFDHGDLVAIDTHTDMPVVNLLSDAEHPCQAVADLMTLAEHLPLEGAKLAYVGDGNNVCNSLMIAATMCGVEVHVATPPGYEPSEDMLSAARTYGEVDVTNDPGKAVVGVDAVYTDVWASMGQEAEAARRDRLFAGFQVDGSLFSKAAGDAIFLHCLPAHRGHEVADEVIDHERSRVFDQAENRLHSFKAVLLDELG